MERLMKQFAPVLPPQDIPLDDLSWDDPVEFEPVMQLDSNIVNAMDKLSRIKELEEHFNGMDCGACGAPPQAPPPTARRAARTPTAPAREREARARPKP